MIVGVLVCFLAAGGWEINSSLKPCQSMDILFKRSGCEQITPLSGTELLRLSQDGRILAAYIDLSSMEILDLTSGEIKTISESDNGNNTVVAEFDIALTSDGSYAAVIGSTTGEPRLGLVDTTLAQPFLQIIPLPAGQYATRAAFSPDDKVLAVAIDAEPDYVAFFHIPDGEQIGRLDFSEDNFVVAYAPGGHLATAMDGRIQIWDLDGNSIERTIGSQLPAVYSMVFSADGNLLAVSSGDRFGFGSMAVDVFRVEDGRGLYKFPARDGSRVADGFPATFSPDGKLLAVATCEAADVFRISDGALVTTFTRYWDNAPFSYGNCLSAVQFTPDGKSVYFGWTDGGVVRWRLP